MLLLVNLTPFFRAASGLAGEGRQCGCCCAHAHACLPAWHSRGGVGHGPCFMNMQRGHVNSSIACAHVNVDMRQRLTHVDKSTAQSYEYVVDLGYQINKSYITLSHTTLPITLSITLPHITLPCHTIPHHTPSRDLNSEPGS